MDKKIVFRNKILPRDKAYIMGIVNVTPDSFSDGGQWLDCGIEHALSLVADGADIVDIGGESTRPGHTPVSCEEEAARVIPVVKALCKEPSMENIVISVDTRHPEVALLALEAGADAINSVAEFEDTKALMCAAAKYGAGYIYTHVVKGFDTDAKDTVREVKKQFDRAVRLAKKCGISQESLVLDPGIGFYKTSAQNIELVENTHKLCGKYPLLMALSRKRFIGEISGKQAQERDVASAALNAVSVQMGAEIVRVHDVKIHVDAVKAAYILRKKNG